MTGGAKRLGRAMAIALAENGFDVAIHYNSSKEEAEKTAETIRSLGRKAAICPADLLKEAESQALLPTAAEALGGSITCLVNNASIFEYDNYATATRESWDRHLDSNLRAPFVLTQALAQQAPEAETSPSGEKTAQALVVNMIDQRVRKLTPEFASYTIAKMGLWAMTRTAAQGLAPHVRVNAIAPGTTLIGERQSQGHFDAQRSNSILARGANPPDICRTLIYLVKSPAVTGQLICVDGGQHLGWQTSDILGLE